MKAGDRVGAIFGSDPKTKVVEVFGYGVYEGRFPYSEPAAQGSLQEAVKDEGCPNPRILLDSGERVWGCECWWGTEAEVRRQLEGRTIRMVTVSQVRARARGEA